MAPPRAALIAAMFLLAAGCLPRGDRVVPHKPAFDFETDYQIDATYRLRQPVFLRKYPMGYASSAHPKHALMPENSVYFDYLTFDHHHRREGERWREVRDILPAGAIVQFKEIRLVLNDTMGLKALPLVRLPGLQVPDLKLFEATAISQREGSRTLVDPQYLELVTPTGRIPQTGDEPARKR